MPKLNLDSIEAANISSDGFTPLPAGGYVVKIVDVMPEPDAERVWLVFDIAEGDYKGYYSDAYGIEHPTAHRLLVSWKQTALGMLKGRLNLITECNAGFDAAAAFEADKWTLFHGRLLGLVMDVEDYTANNGDTRQRPDWFHAKWKSVDAIREGRFKAPQPRIAEPVVTERSASTAIYDDIPFE